MKYLPLYKKWIINGKLPHSGLCNCFEGLDNVLRLFEKYDSHSCSGYAWYWGYDGVFYDFGDISKRKQMAIKREFTTLRQNIVLLMAAMAGEL